MNDEAIGNVVLVDTDVVSYIYKEDSRQALYKPHLEGRLKAIAAQTLAELEVLPLKNNWSSKRHFQLREYINENFTFIEVTKDICLKWSKIQFEARKKGRPIAVGDTWIAATALAFQIPLVTHNYKDFSTVADLEIITENK